MWIPISCCPYGFKTELFHHLCLLLNKQFSHGLVELIISMLIFEPNLVKIWISNGDLLAIQESQIYLKSEFPMATSGEPNLHSKKWIISMLIFEPNLVKIWISNGDLWRAKLWLCLLLVVETSRKTLATFLLGKVFKPELLNLILIHKE